MEMNTKDIIGRVMWMLHTDSKAAVARALGKAGTNTITNAISRNTLDIKPIFEIATDEGVNLHWILTGEGPRNDTEARNAIQADLVKKYPHIQGFILACHIRDLKLMKGLALKMAESFDDEIKSLNL